MASLLAAFAAFSLTLPIARAPQDPQHGDEPQADEPVAAGQEGEGQDPARPSPEQLAYFKVHESCEWVVGPGTGQLGTRAKLEVPEAFQFTGGDGTKRLMEATHNAVSGRELGFIEPADQTWFVVFEFDDSGYVKDDEKGELDADALLKSLREGQDEANEARKERGWETLEIKGWATPPHYDPQTNNLEWATLLTSSSGGSSVNHNTRLLGRKGCMEVTLVCSPEMHDELLPQFHTLLAGFGYVAGERYSEFSSGDKVAEYGLAALVLGGATAVAAKTGLLTKFWKILVIGFVAIASMFKRLFAWIKRLFTGNGKSETARTRE